MGGGKMIRGRGGIAGAGLYFARQLESKNATDTVVLECDVSIGQQKQESRHANRQTTFASLTHEGFDSVIVDRGLCAVEGPHFGKPSGKEVVVYSWDQVEVL